MRAATAGKRGKFVAMGEKVGGEACTRGGKRGLEVKDGSRFEARGPATACRWDARLVKRVRASYRPYSELRWVAGWVTRIGQAYFAGPSRALLVL